MNKLHENTHTHILHSGHSDPVPMCTTRLLQTPATEFHALIFSLRNERQFCVCQTQIWKGQED